MGNKMIKIDEYWKKVEEFVEEARNATEEFIDAEFDVNSPDDIPEVIRDDDWCNNPKSSR